MPDLSPIAALPVPAVAPAAPTPATQSPTDAAPDGAVHPSFEQHLRSALATRHTPTPRSGRSESSPSATDDEHTGDAPAAASDDAGQDGSSAPDAPTTTTTTTVTDIARSALALLGVSAPTLTPPAPIAVPASGRAAGAAATAPAASPSRLADSGVGLPDAAGSNARATAPTAYDPATSPADLPTTLTSTPAFAAAPAMPLAGASASPAAVASERGESAPTTAAVPLGGERAQIPADGVPRPAPPRPPVASDPPPGSTLPAGATPATSGSSVVVPDPSAAATATAGPARPAPSGAALSDRPHPRGTGALEPTGSSAPTGASQTVADPAQSLVASQTATDTRQPSDVDGVDTNQSPASAGAIAVDQTAASLSTVHTDSPLAAGPDHAPASDVASQIAHQADLFRLPNGRGVRIQLHPDDLGGVDVTLRYLPSGGVQLHIAVEHAATGQLVQDGWSDLRDALAAQGITPDRLVMSVSAPSAGSGLDLSFNGRDAGGAHPDLSGLASNGGHSGQSQQHSSRQGGGSASRGWIGPESDTVITTSDDTDRGTGSSRIDYRV